MNVLLVALPPVYPSASFSWEPGYTNPWENLHTGSSSIPHVTGVTERGEEDGAVAPGENPRHVLRASRLGMGALILSKATSWR